MRRRIAFVTAFIVGCAPHVKPLVKPTCDDVLQNQAVVIQFRNHFLITRSVSRNAQICVAEPWNHSGREEDGCLDVSELRDIIAGRMRASYESDRTR